MTNIKITSLQAPVELLELTEAEMKTVIGGATSRDGIVNDFAGTGFMFSIGNLVVSGRSVAKLFNQDSDADNS
ncbi:MAG: hypothetical protein RM368_36305 [Nostoc sp. DedSLP03]|uniref:hypothetical protein n=1 Tax=Nostoc sp. DedSLP03 TaxID=3075400 RepID=UPI002AD42B4A|nr:hypothetical protein [Nostoc sp. DedSLP03]MDZ7970333.1 hypothetical protein [Nostoc sp. DedSLP03]